MPDMLLSVGVDDRRVGSTLRGMDAKLKAFGSAAKAGEVLQKGLGGAIGVAGGGGAFAMELAYVSRAVSQYESKMLAGERATSNFRRGMGDLTYGVGRGFELWLQSVNRDLGEFGGLGGAFDRLTSRIGVLIGGPGAGANIAGVDAAVAMSEKQTAEILSQRENAKIVMDQQRRIAEIRGDDAEVARMDARAYVEAERERLSALQLAGKLGGSQYADRMSDARRIGDMIEGEGRRRAAERAEADRDRWSADLDRVAAERQREEEEKRRAEEDRQRVETDRRHAREDADLERQRADEYVLRAAGRDREADSLGVVLDYRRRIAEIDRNALLDEEDKAALYNAAEKQATAELQLLSKPREMQSRSVGLDMSVGGNNSSIVGQVFGTGANVRVDQTAKAATDIAGVMGQVAASLQEIARNTASGGATYR